VYTGLYGQAARKLSCMEGAGSGGTGRPDSYGPSPSLLASQFPWGGLGWQEQGVGWSH